MSTETTKAAHGRNPPAIARSLNVAPARFRGLLRYRGLWRMCCGAAAEKPSKINDVAVLQLHREGGKRRKSGAALWRCLGPDPPMCDPLPLRLSLAVITSAGTGFSLLRHSGFAQPGEIRGFE